MLCSRLRGELAARGLEGGTPAVPFTDDLGVVDEGEAKPPGALGLTTCNKYIYFRMITSNL